MRELQGVMDYREDMVDGTVAIEPKLDGWRIHARHVDGVPKLFTRNGMEISLPHIQRELALALPQGFFFDGELTHPEGFEKIKGAIARQDEDLNYHVFDMVSESFFETGEDERPYRARRLVLDVHLTIRVPASDNRVHSVTSRRCEQAEVEDAHDRHLELGYEGSVVKRLDSLYASGPTGDWMRIKPVSTVDCVIMGVERSETDPSMASSLIVMDPDGIVSKVHSGMTKQFLRDAIEHPARLVDQVMEASHRGKYNSGKMRHASFERLRPDKSPSPQGVLV